MSSEVLQQDLPREVEVAVIGGGIAGVATAYFLAKAGVPVALFEKGRIAGEQSSRNWGWVRKQGRDPAEMPAIIESLKLWENLESEVQADVGWHRGGVTYLAASDEDMDRYEDWLGHARPYQLDSRLLTPQETDELLGQSGRQWKGALHTPSDGRAEPAKAVPALAKAAERLGGRLFENCAVRTVETASGQVSGLVTERGPVACKAVVCAAGAWSSYFSRNLGIDFPQLAVRSSVLRTTPAPLITQSAVSGHDCAFRRRQDGGYTIARGIGVFEIVPDGFRYLRPFLPGLLMSLSDIRIRLTGAFFRELSRPRRWGADDVTVFEKLRVLEPAPDQSLLDEALASAKQRFPQLQDAEIAETWAGMIDVTPDALPIICEAESPRGYYILSGFSGHGFGIGPGAGLLMSELILKGEARCDLRPFRLSRFSDGSKLEPYSPF